MDEVRDLGPDPGVSAICSGVAASSASREPNCWARLRPVTNPTPSCRSRTARSRAAARGALDRAPAGWWRHLARPPSPSSSSLVSAKKSAGVRRARPFAAGDLLLPQAVHVHRAADTKCLRSCQRRSGQSRLGHLVKTAPSGLTVHVSHTGQRSGGRGGGERSGPLFGVRGRQRTCGMSRRRAARSRRRRAGCPCGPGPPRCAASRP